MALFAGLFQWLLTPEEEATYYPPPPPPTPLQGWKAFSIRVTAPADTREVWVPIGAFMAFASMGQYHRREHKYPFLLDIEKVYVDGVEYRRAPLTETNAHPVAVHSPGFFEPQPYFSRDGHCVTFGNGNHYIGEAFDCEIAKAEAEVKRKEEVAAAQAALDAREAMIAALWKDE